VPGRVRPGSRIVAVLAAGLFTILLCSPAAAAEGAARDPLMRINRPVHALNERLDEALLEPVARVYHRLTPDPVEGAVRNFFDNLSAPVAIVAAALQARGRRTAQASGRFLVNSTVGLGGLLDPATRMGLPRIEEDLGQAFEVWGVENSPYLVLPLLGPTTLVQLPDRAIGLFLPRAMLAELWHPAVQSVGVVGNRADLLSASTLLDSAAIDSYQFTREAYLQRRRYLRHDGELPVDDLFVTFGDDF
jgi:phospholipid-binding lipoprotein MlaA